MKREKELELERLDKEHVINRMRQDKEAELRAQEEERELERIQKRMDQEKTLTQINL